MKQLGKKSLSGALWLGTLKVVIKLFSFAKIVVAARILSPAEIGLFGIVMLPYGLAEVATESGINQALIQTKKDETKYLGSAWLAFGLRGLLIAAGLWLVAPIVGQFYQQPELVDLIRWVAITPLIKGLMNPAVVLFRKNLEFKKEFAFQSFASVVESLATIGFLLLFRSVTALPLGVVAGGLAAWIASFAYGERFKSQVSFRQLKELYAYGKWVTLGTLLSYLTDQGDDLLVSKALGAGPLGLYQTAYKISNLPTTQGAGLIYQVIFPIFAKIQTETQRLKRGLVKAVGITAGLSLLFAAAVYLLAPWAIGLFLGEAWLKMLPALRVLLLFGITRPLISVSSALFDAVGRPQVATQMNLIKLLILAALLWPLTSSWGIVGTAWAVVTAQLLVYPWYWYQLHLYFTKASKIPSVV